MNVNEIKIATAVVTGTVVAGVTYTKIRNKRAAKREENTVKEALESFYSAEFLASTAAKRDIEERMAAGYYANVTTDEAAFDFNQLYVQYLLGTKKI